jgi:NAD(P)-dependent dehydrogenase (short-subunit alcohol dehydrogenase family)
VNPFDYTGKRVVVTGAASGMGEATARGAAQLGAEVHAIDVREPRVDVAGFVATDLRDPAAIDAAVAAITAGGPVHALFNCAGLPGQTDWPPLDVMAVNFCGLRHLTEAVVATMAGNGAGGAVASISSVAGMGWQGAMPVVGELLATPTFEAAVEWCKAHEEQVDEGYAFSKMCIIAYTASRAVDLLSKGIRINCTSPGPTDTAMMPHFERGMGKQFMDDFPRPVGRNATAEEQAWPLLFLNSDAASYVAGANLFVDGGFTGGLFTGTVDLSALAGATEALQGEG